MRCVGMTESMIPSIDDLNLATFKIRNFRNRMIPPGFDIDLGALENIVMGASGDKPLTPQEGIDLFFETGMFVGRRSGISMDENPNYKAIIPISNDMANHLIALGNDIVNSKNALREITGLNELTDGSTPDAKMLTTTANLANESTNNALYPYVNARRKAMYGVAKGVVLRLGIALDKGPYDGYNTVSKRFITIPQSIRDWDYDIILDDRPTQEQKDALMMLLQKDIQEGFLNTGDAVHIMNTHNIKDAQMVLTHRANKNSAKVLLWLNN
jgi:hypothetical protein